MYKDIYGEIIHIGDCLCFKETSYIVESTFQTGLCIKDFNQPSMIQITQFKTEYQCCYGKNVIPLEFLNLDDVFICDREAYPECFI